jgi:hypothetical protein
MQTMTSPLTESTHAAPVQTLAEPEASAELRVNVIAVRRRGSGSASVWHRGLARVLLGALAVQLFFAGLGVFGVTGFAPHAILGSVIILTSFALPILAWRGRLGSALTRRSWLLAALMIVQGGLIDAARLSTVITALHPVNAMLLVLLTFSMAI